MKKVLITFIALFFLTNCDIGDSDPKTSTLTFNSNGGSGVMEDITVQSGTTITLPKVLYTPPTDELSFISWNTKQDGSGASYEDMAQMTLNSENITLYAIWKDIRFITKWNVMYNVIKFPLIKSNNTEYEYDFIIDWGDGTVEHITATDNNGESYYISHNYTNNGTYIITVKGKCKGFGFSFDHLGNPFLTDVLNWGSVQFHNEGYVFDSCDSLITFSATDTPDLSHLTSIRGMFQGADNFNGDISKWDISTIKNISDMFNLAINFNQDLSNWDTSNVTNMHQTFFRARAFNSDISSWETHNVESMCGLFRGTASFDQDISGWDTSKVTDMRYMFEKFTETPVFNKDISSWDVSSVTKMDYMFKNNTNFNCGNIDISTWNWNVSNTTTKTEIFTGSLLEANPPAWSL